MTEGFVRQMEQELGELGICLSEKQMEQFYRYYEMLAEKNKVMNLTAITEEQDVVTKHFCDSLALVRAVGREVLEGNGEAGDPVGDWTGDLARDQIGGLKIIDVGTGAGFPGIPLKIAFPRLKVTLLDSLNKRVKFLEEVCLALGLREVKCVHGRAEDGGRDRQHREKYDLCVSRAVANLASLSEYCMPFVKQGGYFIPYKSGAVEEELNQGRRAVELLGGEIQDVISFQLPGSDAGRSLVKIKKIKETSKKYPRKAGMPSKEPLGSGK